MTIALYRVAWGLFGPGKPFKDLSDFIVDPHSRDFSGVEFPAFAMETGEGGRAATEARVMAALEDTGLDFIAQIATRPVDFGNPAAHLEIFREQAEDLKRLGIAKAAVQTGADSFDLQTAVRFFADCLRVAADNGVTVCFETHRARPFYNPWTTSALLEALPELWLTADFSHWMAVIDRWPDDCMDLFEEAARRAKHIHARIGHEKGPQIVHPGDPAWSAHVDLHKSWWTIAIEEADRRGETMTVSPEFGPPPYMTTHPFTGEPLVDLVEVNAVMRDKLVDWFDVAR